MKLYCDNKSRINIVHSHVQHDRTKHVEVDKHFIKENWIMSQYKHHSPGNQLAYVLTKGKTSATFQSIFGKLGMDDNHSPT